MYINKAFIFGNLTRDPESRALPNGTPVASFSVATNRVYKDKAGVKQESVDYHNVVVFGRQAEITTQYLRKGSSVFVEGRIQTRSWDDKEGKKQYRTEINAESIQFGPKSGGASGEYTPEIKGTGTHAAAANAPKAKAGAAQPQPAELDTIEYPDEDINPDDIPF
jgi:single-strand DNA-binding protein